MDRFVLDANILIYASQIRSPHHTKAKEWLAGALAAESPLLVSEVTEVALLRITTDPRKRESCIPTEHVLRFCDALFSVPTVRRVSAGPAHGAILRELIENHAIAGDDINDTWLAALAIENHATLVSTDADFRKFKGLKWLNPCR